MLQSVAAPPAQLELQLDTSDAIDVSSARSSTSFDRTLPAIVLANIGGILTLLDHAHGWATWLAISAVAAAWVWIGYQSIRARVRPATSTLTLMGLATIVIMLAASWPLLKPTVFHTLGIVQKNPDKR